jgi:hypothetical protein
MTVQEITAEHVTDELCELKRLSDAVGPEFSWKTLRRTVISLDNEGRRIERERPRWVETDQFGHTPATEIGRRDDEDVSWQLVIRKCRPISLIASTPDNRTWQVFPRNPRVVCEIFPREMAA